MLEIERSGDEIIRNILQMAKGSVDDIDFILKREWTGEFNENLQGDVLASSSPNSEQAPAPTDVEGMLKWKPSFLEDFPQNEAATVVITPASVAPIESNKPPSRSPSYNSGTGGGPQIRARTDSLIYAADNRPTPPSVDKALPVVGATSNYNNSISKSRSNQSLIQPDGGSKLSVPVRQGSLPAPSNNGNINSSSNSTNNANNQALMNLKMSMSRELAQLSRNNSENRKSVRSIDSPTSASRSRNSVGKKNFEYMEDYLEEMIRGTGNKEKVEYLESILQVAGNNSNSSPLQRNIPQSPSVSSGYNDSGLSKLLSKTSPSTAVSRRPTSTGSGGVGQDRKKKRPNSTSSNDQTSSALRNVFQDMEADIESTLKRTTTKSSSAAPMTENNNHYSPPRLVTSASTTTSRSVMEAGLKSKLSLSEDIVLPLDKYRESEDLLGSLQRVRRKRDKV